MMVSSNIDFDDFDPLDDILLSDEDDHKPSGLTTTNTKKADISSIEKSEATDKKKKIFDELFGATKEPAIIDENKITSSIDPPLKSVDVSKEIESNLQLRMDAVEGGDDDNDSKRRSTAAIAGGAKASSNWLGLLEDIADNNKSSKDEVVNKEMKSFFGGNHGDVDNTERRRKSEIAASSSAQNAFKKKTSQFKSLEIDLNSDINDSQFVTKQSETTTKRKDVTFATEMQPKLSHEKESVVASDLITPGNKDGSDLQAAYRPSSGISRRHGSAKNKDQVNLFLTPNTSISTAAVPSGHTERKKSSGTLPSWLGGGKENISSTEPEVVKSQEKKETAVENDYNNLEDKNKIAKIPVEDDDKYLNDQRQPVTALKRTVNADVDSLTELKNKQSELYSIVKHQVDLYSKHEKEIKEVALALITKQHENINSLVQMVVSPTSTDYKRIFEIDSPNSKTNMEENFGQIVNRFNVSTKIKELELENADLEIRLQYSERKNELQSASLEEAYNQKITLLAEHENRLKEEIKTIEEDYKVKLSQQKQNESELVQNYKDRIEYLQNERMADLKKIEELNNLIRNNYSLQTLYNNSNDAGRNHVIDDAELVAKEELLIKKEKQLTELQDDLSRQKFTFESKKSSFEERLEQFELNCAKEKINTDQQKKELKRWQMAFQQKQEMWQHETDRENEYLSNYKLEIEDAKQNLLKQEKSIAKQKFELAAERSRLEAFTQIEGIKPGRMTDVIQARAEVQAAIDEARRLKSILEDERKLLKTEENKLKQERWKLREFEEELSIKTKYVERLAERSNAKYEEGIRALRKAKKMEQELNGKMDEIADKLVELQVKENNTLMEKMAMYKEREMLNKFRLENDHSNIIPAGRQFVWNYPNEAFAWMNSSYITNNRDVIDPKYLILKMKAEQNNFASVTDAASSS